MKAKRFIYILLSISMLGASCRPPHPSEKPMQTPPPLQKSIMWGTLHAEGSILEKCRMIKAAGFDGVEFNSHMDRAQCLAALQSTDLKASAVCNDKHWQFPLSSPDSTIRRQGIEAMMLALEDAKTYGTDVVLLVPGRVDADTPYDLCWERSTACIRTLLPTAERLGVRIAIENVWNNFLLSPLEAAQYVDQFESPFVGFYFDAGNILPYGWPEQWIDILGKRILRIHIKEFDMNRFQHEGKSAGFQVALLEGSNNWPKITAAAHQKYYGGWFTTEQGACRTQEELNELSARLDTILSY